jgi:hypothetical protein
MPNVAPGARQNFGFASRYARRIRRVKVRVLATINSSDEPIREYGGTDEKKVKEHAEKRYQNQQPAK